MIALNLVSVSSLFRAFSLGLLLTLAALPAMAAQSTTVLTWNPPTPISYGTPLGTLATATVGGATVPGTFVYTPPLGSVLDAGQARISVDFTPAAGGATISSSVNIRVDAAVLTVTSTATTKVYGASLPALVPIITGFVHGDTAATVLTGAPALSTSATATSAVGSYAIAVSKGSLKASKNYALTYLAGTLTVTPATATVQLSNLAQTYSGAGRAATVTTTPAGIATAVTYAGAAALPVNAGAYAVVATTTSANYTVATATGTLVIAKATATVALTGLAKTYNGGGQAATVTTTPAGIPTAVTYDGAAALPVNAGSHAVVATITSANYTGSASNTLVIAKAAATVAITGLTATYDGAAHGSTITTTPAGLATAITYDGLAALPVSAGNHAVVATIANPNYSGTASKTLVIAKAAATVVLTGLTATYDGSGHAATVTTTPAGIATTVTYDGVAALPVTTGNHAVVATIANPNYSGSASKTLVIAKGTATVALTGLAASYDGAGHAVTVTTTPVGLATIVTYDGAAALPVTVGNHAVVATLVSNPNYTGSANATLVIAKGIATVTLTGLTTTYNGATHAATVTTTPAGLATTITYDGAAALPVNAGNHAVVATLVTNPNYTGSASAALVIAKATATVALTGLTTTYNGATHAATVTTTPAGLATTITYDGAAALPVNAGDHAVIATIANGNYSGSTTGTLSIAQAAATVGLTGLAATYDGAGHAASVTTAPIGLATVVTYDGAAALPVDAGDHAVVATIADTNYHGTASGTLAIAKAGQTISLAALHDVAVGDAAQPVTATATSGLPVAFAVSGPAQILAGQLDVGGAGTITVTATQAGDANHLPASPVAKTITASAAGGLIASYFANETLSGTPVLVRTETLIDHDWAEGSPDPLVPADSFSARWDGEIVPRFNEAYTLTFRTDDGVRVWLDGQLVVNYWSPRSAADSTYTFAAVAGRHYPIRIEYYEHTGLAVAKLWWSSPSETAGPIPGSQLVPTPPDTSAPVGTGTGLTASYFANETLAGIPVLTRVDSMDADWGGGSPASSVPVDSFSARWSGELQPRYSEPYTLVLRTDDGVRMWLDGQLVIDDWYLRGAADSVYTFSAEAGRHYAIRIEYYEHFGSAVAQFGWYSAHEFSGAVPSTQLYPLPTPVVDVADLGQPLAEGESATLTGSVVNTGSAIMAYAWTQVSGPAAVSFQPADQTSTVARFPVAGTYVVKLWAFNGHVTVSDATTVTVVASDVSSDLVAYYAFDEASGSIAVDSSGKQHTGTVVDASRATGKSGGALRFTGGSYVYAANNEDLDAPIQALTLAVWLKPDTTLAQMAHPWPMPIYRAQYEDSTGYALMATSDHSDQFGLRLHDQAGYGQVIEANTTMPLAPGAWVHAAGVYDGATAKLYLDGVLVQSIATGPITLRNAPNSPLYLGYGFEGLMDEVRIYHRALSRTDIYGLAQDGSDRRMPGAHAGGDQIVTLLAPTTAFAGSASDDAGSGAPLVATWRQVAGPASSAISDPHSLVPQVTFAVTGSYRFQLEVSDGVLSGRDELRVEVTDGSVDLASGLILHYRADEGTGNLVADSSGLGHDGTFLGNPQWNDDGRFLGALQLDGASIVSTPSAADLSSMTRMTLSLWMRADRALVDMAHPWPFGLNHADYANNLGFALMTTVADSNTFGFRLHTGTGRREVTMDGVTVGAWMQVVATFDGQTMRLFRDGVLVDINVTGPIPLPALDAPLQLGDGFEGDMDDVRIYNRALSPTEVQSLFSTSPLATSG